MTNIAICEQTPGYKGRMMDGSRVAVRSRDKDGNRKMDFYDVPAEVYVDLTNLSKRYEWNGSKTVKCNPPMAIHADGDVEEYLTQSWLMERSGILNIKRGAGQTIDKESLARITFDSRSNARRFLNDYAPVYGADLAQEDICAIRYETGHEEFELHKCYFDIEAVQFKRDDPLKAEWLVDWKKEIWHDQQMVNSIVAYDDWLDTYFVFACHPTWEEEITSAQDGERTIIEKKHKTEKAMLTSFAEWFYKSDFDVVTGWNSAGYDMSVLYHRMESHRVPHCMNGVHFENGLMPREVFGGGAMSPFGIMDSPFHKGGREYLWQQQPLRGVDHLDMMVAFKRLYKDSTNNELVSARLGRVAQFLGLRDGKLESPDFYSKDYHIGWEQFRNYNIRDVELLVQIDDAWNVIGSYKTVQQLVGCQLRSTFYATGLAKVQFNQEAYWKQRTYPYEHEFAEDDDLEGAIVLDPEELGSVGLHDWTVILDFAGLYPSIMCAFNTCHSSKVRPGMPHLDNDMIGHNGVRFRKNPVGVLPKMVLKLDEQRDEYKAKLKEAEAAGDKNASRKWNAMQLSVKRMRASYYGIMAFPKFSWYDPDIAKTITMGGRNALLSIKKKTEEAGFKVVFGHTDSIFVTMPKEWTQEKVYDESIALAKVLTDHVQADLRTDKVVVELEAIMDKYFIAKKNRYAGRKAWDDKKGFLNLDFSEDGWPEVSRKMSGMEAKQTNTAPIGRDIQVDTLASIFNNDSLSSIQLRISDLVTAVRNGEVDDKMLVANAKVNKWLPHHMDWHWSYEKKCDCGECPLPKVGKDRDDDDACYAKKFWSATAAMFHNDVLMDDTKGYLKLDKGDSFSWVHVCDGPTAIPKDGWIGFYDLEQIADYTLDYPLLAEKHVIKKLENIYYGMGWDIDRLYEKTRYSLDAFLSK
jgi:DNA polymerase elongation subunit (family B)